MFYYFLFSFLLGFIILYYNFVMFYYFLLSFLLDFNMFEVLFLSSVVVISWACRVTRRVTTDSILAMK